MAAASTLQLYTIRALTGVVLTRSAHAPRWTQLRLHERLLQGALVQVTSGASVTIEQPAPQHGMNVGGDKSQLTLNKPIVVRLTPTMLRQVHLAPKFVEQGVLLGPSSAMPTSPGLPHALGAAWERFTAIATGRDQPAPTAQSLDSLSEQGIGLALSGKRLRLLTPSANAVLVPLRSAVEQRVVWELPPGAAQEFQVYAWPAEAERGAPAGRTQDGFYTVTFARPGAYFVQVSSQDGVWQSEARPVHVTAPTLASDPSPPPTAAPAVSLNAPPVLVFPPDWFTLAAQAAEVSVSFAWQPQAAWAKKDHILTIVGKNSGVTKRLTTQQRTLDVRLTPGAYTWSVTPATPNLPSAARHFVIASPQTTATTAQRLSLLQAALLGAGSATVYLEDGL